MSCRSYHVLPKPMVGSYHTLPSQARLKPRTVTPHTPAEMAALYGLPAGVKVADGVDPVISIIELGGGYDPAAIGSLFASWGLPTPVFTDLSVDGAKNSYTGDPNSADGEVVLDICVAAGVYSYATGRPAHIAMIFAPNTNQGFTDAVKVAAQTPVCSISWGGPESGWDAASVQAMDEAFAAGNAAGTTYFAASGDSGQDDGTSSLACDYPSSSPFVTACGGTTIDVVGGKIVSEVVWNASGGAGGGGYSAMEAQPSYQHGFVPAGKGRGVPDIAAAADPACGWQTVFGPIGGTSAVAPFMAGFAAVCAAAKGKPLGQINPALYANAKNGFRDITQGNN